MKRILFILFIFCIPFGAAAEEISSFTSDIALHEDGSFDVTETIVYDFGAAQRHGIFRYIAKEHPQDASSILKERYLDVEIEDVTQDGRSVPFEVSDTRGKLEVKIGDANSTISGEHTYVLEYTVDGGYSYFDDGSAELYWDATGEDWVVPIESAVVLINADPQLLVVGEDRPDCNDSEDA